MRWRYYQCQRRSTCHQSGSYSRPPSMISSLRPCPLPQVVYQHPPPLRRYLRYDTCTLNHCRSVLVCSTVGDTVVTGIGIIQRHLGKGMREQREEGTRREGRGGIQYISDCKSREWCGLEQGNSSRPHTLTSHTLGLCVPFKHRPIACHWRIETSVISNLLSGKALEKIKGKAHLPARWCEMDD